MLFGAAGMAGSMAILAGTNYLAGENKGGNAPAIVAAIFLFGKRDLTPFLNHVDESESFTIHLPLYLMSYSYTDYLTFGLL